MLSWQWEHAGSTYEFAKFFFINTANGIYLASHNYLRGFDKGTIRGNFFRSIIAWPFSALFAPVGNALMLPSIVQAKFWSDFVAAIIEGSSKYRNIIRVKDRVIKSLLPNLHGEDEDTEILAVLDILYMFKESPRVKTVIKNQLFGRERLKETIIRILPFTPERQSPCPRSPTTSPPGSTAGRDSDRLCNYVIKTTTANRAAICSTSSTTHPEVSRWAERNSRH
ncbi:MAG: hypothetical protein R2744_12240 [Bacteroidales bacterium]